MIPLPPIGLLLSWWKEILIALLLVALGVQSYRLQGTQGERDLLALEKTERQRRDAMRDMANLKNRERTDEEYATASLRAGAVVVRGNAIGGLKYVPPSTGSGDEATVCFDRGLLDKELAEFAGRNADRLTPLARAGEGIAAAYRACRAYTLNLQ